MIQRSTNSWSDTLALRHNSLLQKNDTYNVTSYNIDMIKSFAHKGLKEFYETGSKKGIQPEHAPKLASFQLFGVEQRTHLVKIVK
jgi:hypothetical protein